MWWTDEPGPASASRPAIAVGLGVGGRGGPDYDWFFTEDETKCEVREVWS